MKRLIGFSLILMWLTSCTVCGGDECPEEIGTNIPLECPMVVTTSQDQFQNLGSGEFSLQGFRVDEVQQNLKLDITINGCDFAREFALFVSEAKSKSLPPQQEAKLVFEGQPCDAIFSGTICFNYSGLERPTVLKLVTGTGVQNIQLD